MPRLFGEKLRHARVQQGTTQSELARRLGLAQHTHISHLEAGRRAPSLDFVLRTANTLGVTTDYLVRDEIAPDPIIHTSPYLPPLAWPPHNFGAKIRQLRMQHSLTQTALTRQLGLTSQGYISKLEAGSKEPSPDLVAEIAALFGVTTDYLLRDDVAIEQTNGPVMEEG